MKTIQIFSILLGLLLASSGCRSTTINAFENEDFFNTHKGDQIVRGTDTIYTITEEGRWLSKDVIDRALDAKMK